MKRFLRMLCLLLCTLHISSALASSAPQSLITWYQESYGSRGLPQDYLAFTVPDGVEYGFILHEGGYSISGFKKEAGEWQMQSSGQSIGDYDPGYLRPHTSQTTCPDGSRYPDELGFDFISLNTGAKDSYRFDGENFTLAGWYDPRYQGEVMVKGLTLEYYPAGSILPECTVTAGDENTLSAWLNLERPATPEMARAYDGMQESQVQALYPGYTLYSYSAASIGRLIADACYARIDQGLLYIRAVSFDSEGTPVAADRMPVPLSAFLLAQGEKAILAALTEHQEWGLSLLSLPGASGDILMPGGDSAYLPQPFDAARLSLPGNILDFDLQASALITVAEDETGVRRLSVSTLEKNGAYQTKTTLPLPKSASLDTWHAGDGEIILQWGAQQHQAGYSLSPKGEWQLSWIMNSTEEGSFDCRFSFYHVQCSDGQRFIGTLPCFSLWQADLSALENEAELKASLDKSGWAVVNNPDPADRLNLREDPSRSAASLGKFYNGTPVQVLKKQGDWYQVRIGQSGLTGWMMKKYLTEGDKMDAVAPAYPRLFLKDPYYANPAAWAGTDANAAILLSGDYEIVGVYQEKQYILLSLDGEISLAPMDWFFPGNG